MKKNMGFTDKLIRLTISAVFVYLYFSGIVSGTVGIVLLALSAVFVLTSFVSICPLYMLLGISTLKRNRNSITEDPTTRVHI